MVKWTLLLTLKVSQTPVFCSLKTFCIPPYDGCEQLLFDCKVAKFFQAYAERPPSRGKKLHGESLSVVVC